VRVWGSDGFANRGGVMPRVGELVAELVPYWETSDRRSVRLYHGDVLDVLRRLPSKGVQCVVTSPPYWG
jgi:predicted methyltransferase